MSIVNTTKSSIPLHLTYLECQEIHRLCFIIQAWFISRSNICIRYIHYTVGYTRVICIRIVHIAATNIWRLMCICGGNSSRCCIFIAIFTHHNIIIANTIVRPKCNVRNICIWEIWYGARFHQIDKARFTDDRQIHFFRRWHWFNGGRHRLSTLSTFAFHRWHAQRLRTLCYGYRTRFTYTK